MIFEHSWQLPSFEIYEYKRKKAKYCLIIPVINEGSKIQAELKAIKKYEKIIDIIIADAGSTDGSLNENFLKKNFVRTLLVMNDSPGLGSQLRMSMAYALRERYEGVITIDGNGKDDPSSIPIFLKELSLGYDFIQGSRFIKGGIEKNTPILRLLGIKLIHAPLISIFSGFRYTDTTNGFRGYSARYLNNLKLKPFRDVFKGYEMMFYLSLRANQLGLKTKEIPVGRYYPLNGTIPTKIKGIKIYIKLIFILLKVILGGFNPKS